MKMSIRTFGLIVCLLLGACLATADEVLRYMLITDGETIYPQGVVASESDLTSATNRVATLTAEANTLATTASDLATRVAAAEATLADIGQDGVWVLEGFVNSIGLLSGSPEYDGAIEIVAMTVATNEDDTRDLTLYVAFDPAPTSISQVTMVGATTLSGVEDAEEITYTCSYPTTVANPKDSTDTRSIYTFTTTFSAERAFAKIVTTEGDMVGVGNYFPIYGGVSVNSENGATAEITDVNGTTYRFIGGILVESASSVILDE